MCIKMSSVEPPPERQSSNLKVFPNWFRNISSQMLVLNLVTIHNILWLNFRFLNFRPAAPALRRSECAQKTSWSCYGWLNTQSVPFSPLPYGFDYPEKQWEKARETERGTDPMTEQSFAPSPGLSLFLFFLCFSFSLCPLLWKMINMLRSISAMLTAGVSLNGFMSTAQGTTESSEFYIEVRAALLILTHIADDLYASQGNWAGLRNAMAVNR